MARNPAEQTVKRYLDAYRSMLYPQKIRHTNESQRDDLSGVLVRHEA
jgi:hypothetical protein